MSEWERERMEKDLSGKRQYSLDDGLIQVTSKICSSKYHLLPSLRNRQKQMLSLMQESLAVLLAFRIFEYLACRTFEYQGWMVPFYLLLFQLIISNFAIVWCKPWNSIQIDSFNFSMKHFIPTEIQFLPTTDYLPSFSRFLNGDRISS